MKKHNVTTTSTKQHKQLASKARRKRRVAVRNGLIERQIARRLKPISQLIKSHEKTIKQLETMLKADETIKANPALMDDLSTAEAASEQS